MQKKEGQSTVFFQGPFAEFEPFAPDFNPVGTSKAATAEAVRLLAENEPDLAFWRKGIPIRPELGEEANLEVLELILEPMLVETQAKGETLMIASSFQEKGEWGRMLQGRAGTGFCFFAETQIRTPLDIKTALYGERGKRHWQFSAGGLDEEIETKARKERPWLETGIGPYIQGELEGIIVSRAPALYGLKQEDHFVVRARKDYWLVLPPGLRKDRYVGLTIEGILGTTDSRKLDSVGASDLFSLELLKPNHASLFIGSNLLKEEVLDNISPRTLRRVEVSGSPKEEKEVKIKFLSNIAVVYGPKGFFVLTGRKNKPKLHHLGEITSPRLESVLSSICHQLIFGSEQTQLLEAFMVRQNGQFGHTVLELIGGFYPPEAQIPSPSDEVGYMKVFGSC